MRRVAPSEIRFEVKRALQELSRSTLRDWAGKPDKREAAIDQATDAVMERLKECEISAPDVKPLDFGDMGRR